MIIYDKIKKMNIWFIIVNGEDFVYFLFGMLGIFVGLIFFKFIWLVGFLFFLVEVLFFLCVVFCVVNNNVLLCDVI